MPAVRNIDPCGRPNTSCLGVDPSLCRSRTASVVLAEIDPRVEPEDDDEAPDNDDEAPEDDDEAPEDDDEAPEDDDEAPEDDDEAPEDDDAAPEDGGLGWSERQPFMAVGIMR